MPTNKRPSTGSGNGLLTNALTLTKHMLRHSGQTVTKNPTL